MIFFDKNRHTVYTTLLCRIAVLVVLIAGSHAQQWTSYTTHDGLADNRVYAIGQDPAGPVWFGTYAGKLSRYSGSAWQAFDRNGENRFGFGGYALAFEEPGTPWFGHSHGVDRYGGGQWERFTTAQGLPDDDIRALAVDADGALWVGTLNGLARFDGSRWTTYTAETGLADAYIFSLAVDSSNAVWAGSITGVSRFDGVSWQTFTSANGFAGTWVLSLCADPAGTIRAGCHNGGIGTYEDGRWSFVTTTGVVDDVIRAVRALAVDASGVVWAAASRTVYTPTDSGTVVSRWNGVMAHSGTSWTLYDSTDGLASSYVRVLRVDRVNSVWAGTDKGVSVYSRGAVATRGQPAASRPAAPAGTFGKHGRYTVGYTGDPEAVESVRIIRPNGAVAARLSSRHIHNGLIVWNGTTTGGRQAAHGMYFVQIRTSHGIVTRKALW